MRRVACARGNRGGGGREGDLAGKPLPPFPLERTRFNYCAPDQFRSDSHDRALAGKTTHVLPVVNTLVQDKSWRIRKTLASDFGDLSDAMGDSITRSDLISNFVSLLKDPEREVRQAATKNLAAYCDLVGCDYRASSASVLY